MWNTGGEARLLPVFVRSQPVQLHRTEKPPALLLRPYFSCDQGLHTKHSECLGQLSSAQVSSSLTCGKLYVAEAVGVVVALIQKDFHLNMI